jgi:hypothetical protein
MKERPIIFSAPMVRAILSGAKTQTRRVMKVRCHSICEGDDGKLWPWSEDAELAEDFWHPCPFGKPGDRLWVRETWKHIEGGAIYDASGCTIDAFDPETIYRADRPNQYGPWMSPIHMPRWASRITLEITDVRVERLKDISEADAVAEGCKPIRPELMLDGLIVRPGRSAVEEFRLVWEQIHGGGSWEKNPWVWVIEFKKLEQQEAA